MIDENDNVVLKRSFLERILEKLPEKPCNLKEELQMIRAECNKIFGRDGNPRTHPNEFKELCHTADLVPVYFSLQFEREFQTRNYRSWEILDKRCLLFGI